MLRSACCGGVYTPGTILAAEAKVGRVLGIARQVLPDGTLGALMDGPAALPPHALEALRALCEDCGATADVGAHAERAAKTVRAVTLV